MVEISAFFSLWMRKTNLTQFWEQKWKQSSHLETEELGEAQSVINTSRSYKFHWFQLQKQKVMHPKRITCSTLNV